MADRSGVEWGGVEWSGGVVVDRAGAATLLLDGEPVVGWRCTPTVVLDGTEVTLVATGMTVEVDELRYGFTAGPLRIELRHSLDLTWAIRWAVTNPTGSEVRLTGAGLTVETADGWVGWAVRAGAEASVAALPTRRRGPVIGFALLQGELRGSGEVLTLPDLVLPGGGQYVLRLRGESYPDAQHFAVGRHDLLPPASWVDAGSLVRIEHQDQAVASATGIDPQQLAELDGAVELEGEPGQVSRLALVGPRGTSEVTVGFAPSLHLVVSGLVSLGEQRWPTGRQGVLLGDAADGLLVQSFLAGGGSTGVPQEVWSEALDGLCARVSGEGSLLAAALLARQAVLTGDPELAGRAVAGLAAQREVPGAAVVAAQVLAAGLVTGTPVPPEAVPSSPPIDPIAWGAQFGFGLRGERLGPVDPVADARSVAAAELQLSLGAPRVRGWACGFAELVQRQRRRILGEAYGNPTAGEAVAWLTLVG